jgi:hypothetical protein
LLYPFDFEKVEKCPNCLACYHKTCLKVPENCPRCMRKRNRLVSVVYANNNNNNKNEMTNAQLIPMTSTSGNAHSNKVK